MAFDPRDDDEDEAKGDMTPMIDIIFLLLIFFILTTKFIPEEKIIASLLPTDKGQSSAKVEIEEPQNVNILIYPRGPDYVRGHQPSHYDRVWHADPDASNATVAVGNRAPIEVIGAELSARGGGELNAELEKVHSYLFENFAGYEKAGARKDQDPIVVHCFSGMPWKFALTAYDAIRAYEAEKNGKVELTEEDLLNAREVNFAPPRVRDYRQWEMGYELFEIIHMK